ncbi:MAG: glycosyltransferase [Thiogranum sp.]
MLLQELLDAAPDALRWAQLDSRAQSRLRLPQGLEVHYVARNGLARFVAEWRLWRASQRDDVILCFNGMPPLFPVRGRVVVFQQNRNLLGMNSLRQFPMRIALRIALERLITKLFRCRVDEYVVQTSTMARDLRRWHGGEPVISVMPFADSFIPGCNSEDAAGAYDFVYVATGDAHKNHERLLDAWLLLAEAGLFPSLVLTVGAENAKLLGRLEHLCAASRLRIENLGELSREQVLNLYTHARALIYPSTLESFGLPLLEAAACGLPIVASELDYVRDLVEPVETFDAGSAVSIARAVRRFLGCPEPAATVMTASGFLERILRP